MPPKPPSKTSAEVIVETEALTAKKLIFLRDKLQKAKYEKEKFEAELAQARADIATKSYGPESLAIAQQIIATYERAIASTDTIIHVATEAICNLALKNPLPHASEE